jgi:hypothetical protein
MGTLGAAPPLNAMEKESVVPMGTRRYALEIAAPLSPRFKTRLERAVTQALLNPTRSLPTLRRAVIAATTELRTHGFDDSRIQDLFARLIEDVARSRALDATSIVSGHPRWLDLTAKVVDWTRLAVDVDD